MTACENIGTSHEASADVGFKIGEAFPPGDELGVRLVALATAVGDLVRVNGWLVGDEHSDDDEDGAANRQYLLRLTISHLHETRETLLKVRNYLNDFVGQGEKASHLACHC